MRSVLLAALVGCAPATLPPEADPMLGALIAAPGLYTDLSLSHDAIVRNTHVYVPASAEPGAPVVMLLHGNGGSADQLLGLAGTASPYVRWFDVADAEGLVLVVPDGELGSDGDQGWNDCRADASTPTTDDTGFLLALLDAVGAALAVDTSRMWVSGTSNGGAMTLRLVAEAPGRVAAAAPLVAPIAAVSECPAPDGTVPVALFGGTDDPVVPWGGGMVLGGNGAVLGMEASVDQYVAAAGANPVPTVTHVPNVDLGDGSRLHIFHHAGPVPVVLVEMRGAGHTEPSRTERYSWLWELLVGRQNHDDEMAEMVHEFFVSVGL